MALYKIESKTLVSDTAIIEFLAIPNTYKDLLLFMNLRAASTGGSNRETVSMKFNGSTSGYSQARAYAYDTSAAIAGDSSTSAGYISVASINNSSEASTFFSPVEVWIGGYAAANTKSGTTKFAQIGSSATYWVSGWGHIGWDNTTAISSMQIGIDTGGNFKTGSTAVLYGIS